VIVPRLPDLEAWAMFARVADAGSFARAAQELGVSTATVSKAVARLERTLSAALFHRTSRRLSLTALGEETAARALRLLGEAEQLESDALDQTATPRGLVRIAGPMSFGQQQIAPLLPDLLRRYPAIQVDLHLSDSLVDLIGGGFDFAVRISRMEDSSLRVRRICDMRIILVAAPAYLAAQGRPLHPRDLEAHACFSYSNAPNGARWIFQGPEGEEATVLQSAPLRINNGEAAMPALEAGLGIAALPEFLVFDAMRAGRLVELLPTWRLPLATLNLVMPPGTLRPARVSAASEFFYRRLSREPWRMAGEGAVSSPSLADR